jgi:hypothetical protein
MIIESAPMTDTETVSDERLRQTMLEAAALNKRVADLTALIEAQHGDVVVRTAKLLYEKDDMIAAAEAENATLKREIAELREATLEAAKVIEEGSHKAVGESYRNDGKPSKNDTCPHGRYHYEDCDQCCADAVRALAALEAKP